MSTDDDNIESISVHYDSVSRNNVSNEDNDVASATSADIEEMFKELSLDSDTEDKDEEINEITKLHDAWPTNKIGAIIDPLIPLSKTQLCLRNMHDKRRAFIDFENQNRSTDYAFPHYILNMNGDIINQPKN